MTDFHRDLLAARITNALAVMKSLGWPEVLWRQIAGVDYEQRHQSTEDAIR